MKDLKGKRILVAMSGGVDSSVAAHLLLKEGAEVRGVFMRLNENYEEAEEKARKVCRHLKIKFYPVNFFQKFNEEVLDYFVTSYSRGITPNPCVECNKQIKFGKLLELTSQIEADYLATGHYVRTKEAETTKLLRGVDSKKDQSYFLYNLNQEDLRRVLFPLGNLLKVEVRRIAEKEKLPYIKKESQDICFLTDRGKIIEHNNFLENKIKLKKGDIRDMSNKVVGEHSGLPLYTLGQRRGIEIGGTGPYYVVKKDFKSNILFVTNDQNDPELFKNSFEVNQINWIDGNKIKTPLKCEVSIRYGHKSVICNILESRNKEVITVSLKKPERAITEGQSAVFYTGDEVLGGGVVTG